LPARFTVFQSKPGGGADGFGGGLAYTAAFGKFGGVGGGNVLNIFVNFHNSRRPLFSNTVHRFQYRKEQIF